MNNKLKTHFIKNVYDLSPMNENPNYESLFDEFYQFENTRLYWEMNQLYFAIKHISNEQV
jgi:hypothetical protein